MPSESNTYTKQYVGDFPSRGEPFTNVCKKIKSWGAWQSCTVEDDPAELANLLEKILVARVASSYDILHMNFMFKAALPNGAPDDPLPQPGFVAVKMYIRKRNG